MSQEFDRRRHPVRPDLAASSYRGQVAADRFVKGEKRAVIADRLSLRPAPSPDRSIDTEALHGETFTVYETTAEDRAWGQLETDGYVGWVSADGLGDVVLPDHRIAALRSYRYPGPDLKFPPLGLLSMGSLVTVAGETETRGLAYKQLADGSYVVARHLVRLDDRADDWVTVAESFLGTPYLWGGRTSLGLDCSALVQLAAQAGGISVPRDTDMQEAEAGRAVEVPDIEGLERGDLIFWKGHVAIAQGGGRLLHANGYTMTVASEPVVEAVQRIAANEWGEVTSVRRF